MQYKCLRTIFTEIARNIRSKEHNDILDSAEGFCVPKDRHTPDFVSHQGMKESKTERNKRRQFSKYYSNFNMAAEMIFAQQSNYSDNTKNNFKFTEKPRSIKILPDLKCQDKTSINGLTSITSVAKNAKNIESSQNLPNKTESGQVSRGRIGRFRNAKLETRYRTNSTDSAFSEESFVDLDSDESTKLESLIDQLIFTDDRPNSDMSTYVKTEKLPSTDTGILDISDLFNNTDIFTMDLECLAHETRASSFLEIESRPDSENTESTSSISSSDSGRHSMYKFPAKMSSFLQCNHDKVLNDDNNSLSEKFTKFSSSLFISSDEEDVIDCEGRVVNKTIVSPHAYDTNRKDGCVNDRVHECSMVDLSALLDVTSYGSPFSAGENLPRDSQRHLNTNVDVVCVNESSRDLNDFSTTYSGGSTNLRQVTSTNTTMSASCAVTAKNNNSSNNKSNNSQNENQLREFNFCPVKEHKVMAPLPSIKNCPVKSIELSEGNFNKIPEKSTNDCDERSQEPLYLYYLENLCRYSDQEMSGINQNNNFNSDTCKEFENKFNLKKYIRESNSTDGQKFRNTSKTKVSEITLASQKEAEDCMDDDKGFNENKPANINDSVLCSDHKLDAIKLESHFPDFSGFSNNMDAINNITSQPSSQDIWILSNEEHVKGDYSYRDRLPAKFKEINVSVTDTPGTSNKSKQMTNSIVKQNPAKRPLIKVLNSENQHLSILEEDSLKSSSKTEFPGLKCLLEEESSSSDESIFYKSANNTYYTFDPSDDSNCIKRKIPKFSIIDNDESRVQSAILYQVLAMEQNSPSTLQTPPPKVKTKHQSKFSSSPEFEGHCMRNLQEENTQKQAMPTKVKDDLSEMKELEKYLRGIIPTETNDEQDETFIKEHRNTSGIFFRRNRSPCSLLKKLLTGEITAQMYREIDQQFCENELLEKNEMKMN